MDYLQQITEYQKQGESFVLATVVRTEKPTSAKPGAKAIITSDGVLHGWIGGSCAEPSVKREAASVLQEGQPRLIRLAPAEKIGANPQEGVTEMTLTCMSGGTLDIYLEPYYPPPHLLVIGHHAAAQALAALAKAMEYTVTAAGEVSPDDFAAADHLLNGLDFSQIDFQPNMYVVVASHGNYDEIALQAALPSRAAYVALVASKKRTETIRNYLRDSGMPEALLARLKYPAGLDIGAITPHEIALSILAEIIEYRRHGKIPLTGRQNQPKEQPKTAVDPICKMTVEIATARYKTEFHGQMVYFCSAHCQRTFEKDPEAYLQAAAGSGSHPERQHTSKSPRGVSQ